MKIPALFIENCIGKLLFSVTWVLTAIECIVADGIEDALDNFVALGIK